MVLNPASPWPRAARFAIALLLLSAGPAVDAATEGVRGFRDWFMSRDLQVVTVTDMTPRGRLLRQPSRARPVYYEAAISGYLDFGRSTAGLDVPPQDEMVKFVVKLLADQGYYPANAKHAPEILLQFSWGTLNGRYGTALKFMGGDKLDVLWELEELSIHTAARALTRHQRSQLADFVVDAAGDGLYVIWIRAFDEAAALQGKLVPLWNTKVSCPSSGLDLAPSLKQMMREAAPYVGRETAKPIHTIAPPRDGKVDLGELKVLEMIDTRLLPLIDLNEPEPKTEVAGKAGSAGKAEKAGMTETGESERAK